MTLYEVTKTLETIALTQHSVKYAGDGDIYKLLNTNPSLKYSIFFITQNNHRRVGDIDYFSFNLFYIDRLLPDLESNALQVQSIGKEVLQNIIETFADNTDADVSNTITYSPFVERFQDECAGVYAVVEFSLNADTICPELY